MSETRANTGPATERPVLGSYRILGEISRGGMGAVFRAEHVLLGRPAAVKLLRSDLSTDADLVQRFVNEAKAVTACKHPGIVEVYDFGYSPDGHAYFVMELLEGESLAHRLAGTRLGETEVAAIAHGIASALKAAHRVGVIHRDLKPDNVFLVPDPDGGLDRTKVLDFGIAKLGDAAAAPSRRTQTGILIGTPLYMAPEQARAAGTIDHRADLYSLGCIIYHMLVGQPPFVADGAGEIIALQMFGEVVPPSHLALVTPEMERLVLRLLEKDPAHRFDSATELMAALAMFDTVLTNRPTWPSGHKVAQDTASLSATLDSSGELRLADAAGPGFVPSRRPVPELAREGAPRPELTPSQRSTVPVIAGITIAVVGAALAYGLLRGGRSVPASTDPVAAPAPIAAPAAPGEPSAQSAPVATRPDPTPTSGAAAGAAAMPAPALPGAASTEPASATLPDPHAAHGHHPAPGHSSARPAATKDLKSFPRKPGDLDLPDKAIEVIRDIRQSEPPRGGAHTAKGSPIETDVEVKGGGLPRGIDRPKDLTTP
jgi:serine/threonine protein kinase